MNTQAGFTEAFLRCDGREAGKSPNHSHLAAQANHRNWAIAEVELGTLDCGPALTTNVRKFESTNSAGQRTSVIVNLIRF